MVHSPASKITQNSIHCVTDVHTQGSRLGTVSQLSQGRPRRTGPLTLRQLGRATLAAAATSVSVRLSVQRDVGYGRSVRLVGAGPLLGDWKPEQGVDLAWTDGNVWTAELAMEPGTALEFKVVGGGGFERGNGNPAESTWTQQGCTAMHQLQVSSACHALLG